MLDTFNINDGSIKRSIFYAGGTNSWQIWQKPQNAKFVHFFVLGSGSGGGGGGSGSIGTNRRGGGSGASGGHVIALFNASQVPDTLFIEVGAGGAGGAGGASPSAGGDGSLSYVMIYPDTGFTATNVLLQSGNAAAIGAAAGSTTGAAGVAGTVWNGTGSILWQMSLSISYAGVNGVLGLTTTPPNNTSISGITTGGGVGAGTNGSNTYNGGSIIGNGNVPTIFGGLSSTQDGSGGYMSSVPNSVGTTYQQMIFTGGGGGSSSNSGSGGNGGNATFGSGGGGGGAGVTSSGGTGGRGGDGLVIITTW